MVCLMAVRVVPVTDPVETEAETAIRAVRGSGEVERNLAARAGGRKKMK